MTDPHGTWIVYLLRCADGSLYTGITNNLVRRVEQHQRGVAAKYTRSRLPVSLVYQEVAAGLSAALRRERAIKSLSKSTKERLVFTGTKDHSLPPRRAS